MPKKTNTADVQPARYELEVLAQNYLDGKGTRSDLLEALRSENQRRFIDAFEGVVRACENFMKELEEIEMAYDSQNPNALYYHIRHNLQDGPKRLYDVMYRIDGKAREITNII